MKGKITLVLALFLITITGLNFNAAEINQQSVSIGDCVETELTVDKDSVYSEGQVKFELKYYSVQPACSAEELAGQRIEIELGDLITGDLSSAITSGLNETNHLVPSIEGTKLVLTFKDISYLLDEGEGLEDFWGSYSFVVKVKAVDVDTPVTINDNVTGSADVTITAPTNTAGGAISNTQKWPEYDYVDQDDYLMYTVRLNNDWKYHEKIHMEDNIPRGMSLVTDDPAYPIRINREIASNNPWPDESYGDISDQFNIDASPSKLVIDSKYPVDYGIDIRYWVHVDNEVASGEYNNTVKATYDDKNEYTDYTVELNGGSSSGQEGAGAYIDLQKTDQLGNPVAGATFKISDGTSTVAEITTDENGYAISPKLPYGEYMVREVSAPDGYQLNSKKFFADLEIDEETVHLNDGTPIVDLKDSAGIKLEKVGTDLVTGEVQHLAGAEFTVTDSDGNQVAVLTTDENGLATSSALPSGTYTVTETKAPAGFKLSEPPFSQTIELNGESEPVALNDGQPIENEQFSGKINLDKVDQDGTPLAGAEFTITDSDGNEVEVITTDETGHAVSGKLALGTYTITETKAPEGYVNEGYTEQITLDTDGQNIALNGSEPIANPIAVTQISLHKADQDGNPLAGAEFTITDSEGNEVEVLTTDETGLATSSDLPSGTYTVTETKAPDGYKLSSPAFTQTVKLIGDPVVLNEGNPIENVQLAGKISLDKVDPDGNPLAGAEFTVTDSEGNEVEVLTTDETGHAISGKLALGKYTVTETKAPDGYANAEYTEKVILDTDGQTVALNGGEGIVNNLAMAQISLDKVDQDGNALAGAEFTITDADGDEVEVLTTDRKGHAVSSDLELGTYTVAETAAPEGYVNGDFSEDVVLDEDGQVAVLNGGEAIINSKAVGRISLDKVDQDGNALAGAEFTITDADGDEVEVLTTDDNGHAESDDIAFGTYTVAETKAPTGYVNAGFSEDVTLDTAGQIVALNGGEAIVNDKAFAKISLDKVDEDGNALAGAEFTITDSDDNEVEVLTTDDAGHAVSNDLELGEYTVAETKAPDGYENAGFNQQVELTEDGQNVVLNDGQAIVNKKIVEQPSEEISEEPSEVISEEPSEEQSETVVAVDDSKDEPETKVEQPEMNVHTKTGEPETKEQETKEQETKEQEEVTILSSTGGTVTMMILELIAAVSALLGIKYLVKN